MNKYKITFKGYSFEHKLGINAILQSCPDLSVLEINPTKDTGYCIIGIKNKFGKIILDTLKNADCLQAEEIEKDEKI